MGSEGGRVKAGVKGGDFSLSLSLSPGRWGGSEGGKGGVRVGD